MSPADLEILLNSLPTKAGEQPKRPPDFAIRLLEETCERTGLDWKLRHVYLMQRGGKWGVTLSIDGFRHVGSRAEAYGGQEGPFWVTAPDGTWSDVPPDGKVYAAKVGIKHNNGITTWGVAKFADYKAGPMWDKFPSTMIAKCAEMLAWRKAFPGKLGGLYGLEEMAQADKAVQKELEDSTPSTGRGYAELIEACQNQAELAAIGAQIKKDSSIPESEWLRLKEVYTKAKNALSQSK